MILLVGSLHHRLGEDEHEYVGRRCGQLAALAVGAWHPGGLREPRGPKDCHSSFDGEGRSASCILDIVFIEATLRIMWLRAGRLRHHRLLSGGGLGSHA